MRWTATKNNIHIVDSYQVSKWHYRKELKEIKAAVPDIDVWKRSFFSLYCEWAVHNACYWFHIWREETRSVDLNYPQKWYMRIAYTIFGIIALILTK